MKVYDYWMCANKHLDFCEEILKSSVYKSENSSKELNNLIDIYYMLGYIFEGFTICIAYSLHYRLDDKDITWDMTKDVDYFDPEFIAASHLAFDRCETKLKNAFDIAKKRGLIDLTKGLEFYINAEYAGQEKKEKTQDASAIQEWIKTLTDKLKKLELKYIIKFHQFNRIVEGVIRTNLLYSINNKPIPFFQSDISDPNQLFLIEKWSPEIRYSYSDNFLAGLKNNNAQARLNEISELKEKITEENLLALTTICRNIGQLIPEYFPHFTHKGKTT